MNNKIAKAKSGYRGLWLSIKPIRWVYLPNTFDNHFKVNKFKPGIYKGLWLSDLMWREAYLS